MSPHPLKMLSLPDFPFGIIVTHSAKKGPEGNHYPPGPRAVRFTAFHTVPMFLPVLVVAVVIPFNDGRIPRPPTGAIPVGKRHKHPCRMRPGDTTLLR